MVYPSIYSIDPTVAGQNPEPVRWFLPEFIRLFPDPRRFRPAVWISTSLFKRSTSGFEPQPQFPGR